MEYIARVELGMSSSEFWDLTWYDWGLWCSRIIHERKKRQEDRELSIEMTRSMMALTANIHRKKGSIPFKGRDFFPVSYDPKEDDRYNVTPEMAGMNNKQFMEEMKRRFGKKKKRG